MIRPPHESHVSRKYPRCLTSPGYFPTTATREKNINNLSDPRRLVQLIVLWVRTKQKKTYQNISTYNVLLGVPASHRFSSDSCQGRQDGRRQQLLHARSLSNTIYWGQNRDIIGIYNQQYMHIDMYMDSVYIYMIINK